MLLVFNLVFTANFATVGNLRLQLVQVAPVAIVALGMALVIGTEGIDLSVGSAMAIAAALIPLYLGYGVWPADRGRARGRGRGRAGQRLAWSRSFGIQPIIATLGLLVAGRGLALVFADGRLTELFDPTLLASATLRRRVPISVLLVAVAAGAVARSCWRAAPRSAGASGDRWQPRGGPLAGLPVKRTLVTVYVVSRGARRAGRGADTARQGASDPSFVGLLIELSAITAVVVGGTPLSGGRVRILGTLTGALLMQLIMATVIQHNLPDSFARMIQAGIIVAAVYVQRGRTGA